MGDGESPSNKGCNLKETQTKTDTLLGTLATG